MADYPVTPERLTNDEWTLVRGLRDIPDGLPRQKLFDLMKDLVDFVRDPRCSKAQADGVPCGAVPLACEECQSVAGALVSLHRRLRLL